VNRLNCGTPKTIHFCGKRLQQWQLILKGQNYLIVLERRLNLKRLAVDPIRQARSLLPSYAIDTRQPRQSDRVCKNRHATTALLIAKA
jgi:hypothetical protein